MRYRQLAFQAGIYLITNGVSGKFYIGSARDLSERRRRHFGHLRTNRHFNPHLQSAWNKYGENSFTFSILLVCGKKDLIFYEQRALDVFRASCGVKMLYNVNVLATTALGRKMSPEVCAKLSAANTRPMLGRKHTPETRLRLSLMAKERCSDPEWRERMRIQNTGRTDSPETREKRRASALARAPMADVSKEKVRASKLGKPRPPGLIANLTKMNTGRRASGETKAKMSDSQKLRWTNATQEEKERTRERLRANPPPRVITPSSEIVQRALALRSEGLTQREIARQLNVSSSSARYYLRAGGATPAQSPC